MSDIAATFWCAAAVLAALCSRRRMAWAAAAGAAFAMAVLLRPTAAVLLPALLIALPFAVRHYLVFAAGGAPLAAVFLAYNNAAYGNPFLTVRDLAPRRFRAGILSGPLPPLRRMAGSISPLVPLGWGGPALLAPNPSPHAGRGISAQEGRDHQVQTERAAKASEPAIRRGGSEPGKYPSAKASRSQVQYPSGTDYRTRGVVVGRTPPRVRGTSCREHKIVPNGERQGDSGPVKNRCCHRERRRPPIPCAAAARAATQRLGAMSLIGWDRLIEKNRARPSARQRRQRARGPAPGRAGSVARQPSAASGLNPGRSSSSDVERHPPRDRGTSRRGPGMNA